MSIANSHSVIMSKAQQDVLTCLKYAEDGGLFSRTTSSDLTLTNNHDIDDGAEEVHEEQLTKEEIWKAEYKERRLQWKKNACEPPSVIDSRSRGEANSGVGHSILHDGSAFRASCSTEQDIENYQPSI